jgi:hypothetical protein
MIDITPRGSSLDRIAETDGAEPVVEFMEVLSTNAVFEIYMANLVDSSGDDLGHFFRSATTRYL